MEEAIKKIEDQYFGIYELSHLDWFINNDKLMSGDFYDKYTWIIWYKDEFDFTKFRSIYKDFEQKYIDWHLYHENEDKAGRKYFIYEIKRPYLYKPFIKCAAECSRIKKEDL